jgi:transcriptional regulator of heat shock response
MDDTSKAPMRNKAHSAQEVFALPELLKRMWNDLLSISNHQVVAVGSEVELPLKSGDAIVYQKYAVVRFLSTSQERLQRSILWTEVCCSFPLGCVPRNN